MKKNKIVLAIVDGSNIFSPNSCKFITKQEAIKKGYIYVEGDSKEEMWFNMMMGNVNCSKK